MRNLTRQKIAIKIGDTYLNIDDIMYMTYNHTNDHLFLQYYNNNKRETDKFNMTFSEFKKIEKAYLKAKFTKLV